MQQLYSKLVEYIIITIITFRPAVKNFGFEVDYPHAAGDSQLKVVPRGG